MAKQIEVKLYFYADGQITPTAEGLYIATHETDDPFFGVIIGHKTVEVMPPDFNRADIVTKQVNNLNKEKEDIRAQTQLKLNEIDEQINKLLALEAPAVDGAIQEES